MKYLDYTHICLQIVIIDYAMNAWTEHLSNQLIRR